MSKLIVSCIVLVTLVVSLIVIPCVNASSSTWSKTYGGEYNDRAFSLIKTQEGGYAIIGTSASFSSTGLVNAYLVATDVDGNLIWNQTYAGLGATYPCGFIQTSDGGYAFAGYSYALDGTSDLNSWFAKTDSSGNLQWNKTYTEFGNLIGNLVQTADGGYALVGYRTISEDFIQAWMGKIDADGNIQWTQDYGTSGDNELYTILQTSDSSYFLGGYTSGAETGLEDFWLIKVDTSGNIIWNQTYGGSGYDMLSSFVQTSDGGFALFGYSNSSGNGSEDFMMVKADSSGTMQWTKTYGGTDIEEAFCGIQTIDGGYAMTGVIVTANGTANGFLIKTDENGNLLWNKTYTNSDENVLYTIIQANDGGYALTGYTNSSSTYQDFWLLKTDENGTAPAPTVSPSSTAVSPSPTIPEFSAIFVVALIGVCTTIIALATRKTITQKRHSYIS